MNRIEAMKKLNAPHSGPLRRAAQRGVSLIFALMALVVLSLGAVALIRSIDTGLLVLGNMGLKQDALAAGSAGTEAAIAWIQSNSTTNVLNNSVPAQGYSAVAVSKLDPTGRGVAAGTADLVLIDWDPDGDTKGCQVPGLNGRTPSQCLPASAEIRDSRGNAVRYVITRLCALVGADDASNDCVQPNTSNSTGTTSQRGSLGYGGSGGQRFTTQSIGTYFRIITRTEGVRGTVSYTETLVHF